MTVSGKLQKDSRTSCSVFAGLVNALLIALLSMQLLTPGILPANHWAARETPLYWALLAPPAVWAYFLISYNKRALAFVPVVLIGTPLFYTAILIIMPDAMPTVAYVCYALSIAVMASGCLYYRRSLLQNRAALAQACTNGSQHD